ncbi:MAG: single-stranded DNA-binding protein [Clostridia bacterium]|nr:single-stranded DNA-binding protein [Clostridia bacterium]MDE6869377.1 single-stranded DNA-binding protein [Clostridia bacterium]MDE7208876.1 single-stranded DNA-binding protein [Clostridia bacterium]
MNYEQMNNNKLQLVGTVVKEPIYTHEVFGEGFYETVVAVPRLSEQKDYIPITISDRLLVRHEVQVGNKINLVGQFRSYNKIEGEKSKLLLTAFVRDLLPMDETVTPNSIEITGYICKPPIYRTTPFKREICDVLIAVNRAYNKSDYIPCIMWGRNARFVQNMKVGEKLTVVGRIQSRTYVKNLGEDKSEERVAYEVSVSKINPIDRDDSLDNMEIASAEID